MTPLPILYSFRRCPYAMRARMALRQAGLAVELREVLLRAKPAALLAASPKGTVPVLLQPDGTLLDQSLDIMQWALRQHDADGWLTQGDPALGQRLIGANDGPFKALLDRYKYPERHPQSTRQHHRDEAVALHLQGLDARLGAHAWLLGPGCALADVALFPFVRQFAQVDAAWFEASGLDHLRAWLQRLAGSALFESVMAKHPAWQEGDPPVRF
jgi:glutathione S-transferase